MEKNVKQIVEQVIKDVEVKNPGQSEFHQTIEEVLTSLIPVLEKNPAYGEIVCRCEEISRGEIIDALSRSVPCETVDGVKKRCRPGMGRCQGGFCGPLVAKIISEEKGIPLCDVRKAGEGSSLLFRKSKGGNNID